MSKRIDMARFTRDSSFYGDIPLLLTIKSFDLQAIRKRYIESKKRSQRGSVARRPVSLGGLVSLRLHQGSVQELEELVRVKEPRGLDYNEGRFAFSSESTVYVLDKVLQKIENDWFSYIHTVEFSPHENDRLLVSSSGLDILFEYDLKTQEITWEWSAWEHGMNEGHDPDSDAMLKLTRDPQQFSRWQQQGIAARLIDDPNTQSLPTAMRAAFINSSSYDHRDEHRILATLFHKGKVIAIDRRTGDFQEVISQLTTPHGGKSQADLTMATSTGSGEIHLEKDGKSTILDFSQLSGKPEELGEMEWIQNAIVHEGLLIAIDSNRNSFVIIDTERELYDMISYDLDWAVQDLVVGSLNASQKSLIQDISNE
ncbi:MAG: hypothetical protein HKN79_11390 [Flavobacteriales bacterium]|nr:hypothetical protein [Flavobacteriales bacterium]